MTMKLRSVDPHLLTDAAAFRREVMKAGAPVLLPGAAAQWQLLSGETQESLIEALLAHDVGKSAEIFVGEPGIEARYYYDQSLTGFNFAREDLPFADALRRIVDGAGEGGGKTLYMGSLPCEHYLPGIEALAPLAFLPATVRPRFWIGHASQVACHYDQMDNVACVASGRRRFTLYPPQAIADLYVGPIDHTMAGQPVGMAAQSAPGDSRFPRFEKVRDQALVAELAPGDAIYIPKLWWHQVEALDPFNVLVNFWWDGFASGPDSPYATMLLAMIAIAERPVAEREAWKAWFDHYVFRPEEHPLSFLPEERHGILGPLSGGNYQRLRMIAMRMLRGG
jgi:hypothetical protein